MASCEPWAPGSAGYKRFKETRHCVVRELLAGQGKWRPSQHSWGPLPSCRMVGQKVLGKKPAAAMAKGASSKAKLSNHKHLTDAHLRKEAAGALVPGFDRS